MKESPAGVFLLRFNLVLLAIVAGLCSAPAHLVAADKITAIEIRGNRKIESDAIQKKILSTVGGLVSSSLIETDIKSIFGMGYFKYVEVQEEEQGAGVKLIYKLVEKPTVRKIEYRGLDALSEDDAKEQTVLKLYEVLDYPKIAESIEKLKKKYEEKGYYIVDIREEVIEDEKTNEVEVVLHIQENDKIQVREINIVGNEAISDDELKGVMATQEGGPFSWLTDSGTYREAAFERDFAALSIFYGMRGYVKAQFKKPQVTVSPDKKWINITFSVVEGDQYFVGDVDFRGDLLFDRQELLDDLQLIKGEVFNTETLRRETLKYTEKYSDLGYAFANIVPQPNIHEEDKTVDLIFDVDLGQRVYIGKITITGNTKTKDRVVRRQLTLHEGELFSGTKKRESRENVLRLGFFDVVEFNQNTSKTSPDVVDINIDVKERSTGQLVIGAGFGSGDIGFTAHAQLSQNNFLGNGQIASLSAQIQTGNKYYEFSLSFTEPYVGYSNWSLGGELFHLRRVLLANGAIQTFSETKTGAAVRLGHPILDFTDLFLTYKFEKSTVPESSIIDKTLIPPSSVNGYASSVTAKVVYDRRDDRFDPRQGLYWDLSGEFAGVGGDRKFFKSRTTVKYFHPIIWDFIFRSNFTAANISGVGNNAIPINELFVTGGLFSLRGYENLSVGPKRRLSSNPADLSEAARSKLLGKEIVIGGTSEVVMNVEIEFPILKEARLKGAIFFDAGNAFNGVFKDPQPALLANFGWGIRWFTPIGPLRFEFGYPIVNPGPPRFHFTIGPPF